MARVQLVTNANQELRQAPAHSLYDDVAKEFPGEPDPVTAATPTAHLLQCTFMDLPTEILQNIFQHITSVADFRSLIRLNSRIHDIVASMKEYRRRCPHRLGGDDRIWQRAIVRVLHSNLRNMYIILSDCASFRKNEFKLKIWSLMGPRLLKLELVHFVFDLPLFVRLFSNVLNLESLVLRDCSFENMLGIDTIDFSLSQLQELILTGTQIPSLVQSLFDRIAPGLKRVSTGQCRKIAHYELASRTGGAFLDVVADIHIWRSEDLAKILEAGLKFTQFTMLKVCRSCQQELMFEFIVQQKQFLRRLTIPVLLMEHLLYIFKNYEQLRELEIISNYKHQLESIGQLRKLTDLRLRYNGGVETIDQTINFGAVVNENLKFLQICRCGQLSLPELQNIHHCFPNIQSLKLSPVFGPSIVSFIGRHFQNLQKLDMVFGNLLSVGCATKLSGLKNLVQLRELHLTLRNIPYLTNWIADDCLRFRDLGVLGLRNDAFSSTDLSDASIVSIVKNNPNLRCLELTNNYQLTDEAVRFLSTELKHLRVLKMHFLYDDLQHNLTERSIEYLIQNSKNLQHLEIPDDLYEKYGQKFRGTFIAVYPTNYPTDGCTNHGVAEGFVGQSGWQCNDCDWLD